MTDTHALGTGIHLDFMAPLSADRADRLVRSLAARQPATVIDYGCGWGELLLRVVAAVPDGIGVGLDNHGPDLERGRRAAAARGLGQRVSFIDGAAEPYEGSADLAISVGAYQAFGTIPDALAALRTHVKPGGVLLFGAEFWEQSPPAERLAKMWPGMTEESTMYLPDVVDAAVTAGMRPLRIETVARGEWEEFESGLAEDSEEWLLANPGHPGAEAVRAQLDTQRAIWLRGHRDLFGFAYLTLGVPAA